MPSMTPLSTRNDTLRLYGVLLRLVRVVEQRTHALAEPGDVALPELGVLGQVERGVDAPSKIARALRLDPARVTHLTDRLVALGYIERLADESDRRRFRLRLTEAGAAWLRRGREHARRSMDTLLGALSDEEREGLLHGLDGVQRVLDSNGE